jgi:D-threo-aldose 1-dehydrogenase
MDGAMKRGARGYAERTTQGGTGRRLAFGVSPLGPILGPAREAEATALVWQAHARGIRHFDVAPSYGLGVAELRLGAALRHLPAEDLVVSTKVGRLLHPDVGAAAPGFRAAFDYGADAIRQSLRESMQRLGRPRIDLVLVHDLSRRWHGDGLDARIAEALAGAFPLLSEWRQAGMIGAIGVGTNDAAAALRLVETVDLDVVMLAGAPTLLDSRSPAPLLRACAGLGIAVIAAAPFNSGILATGARSGGRYFYAEAPAMILSRVSALEALCSDHGIPLGAAALQMPLREPAVVSVLPGFAAAAELQSGLAWYDTVIPADFWTDLMAVQDAWP